MALVQKQERLHFPPAPPNYPPKTPPSPGYYVLCFRSSQSCIYSGCLAQHYALFLLLSCLKIYGMDRTFAEVLVRRCIVHTWHRAWLVGVEASPSPGTPPADEAQTSRRECGLSRRSSPRSQSRRGLWRRLSRCRTIGWWTRSGREPQTWGLNHLWKRREGWGQIFLSVLRRCVFLKLVAWPCF